jgi:dTDP-4-amino-4,6-dideoxygalactose transaminase
MNSRLDEIHAAMLAERVKWLLEFTERRRQIANDYQAGINNPTVRLLASPEEPSAHVFHLYVVTCEQRDALQKHLQQSQVQSHIHYPIPIHHQEPCLDMARDPRGLVNTERHAATCLSLPCHPQMMESDIAAVIAAVNSFQGA